MMVGFFYVHNIDMLEILSMIGNVTVTKYKVKCRKRGEMCQMWSFYFLLSEFYINGKKEERNNFVYSKKFLFVLRSCVFNSKLKRCEIKRLSGYRAVIELSVTRLFVRW